MATLRYIASFYGNNAEIIRPYPCVSDSVEQLESFLDSSKHEFGEKLRWVSIERTEETVLYSDFVEWDEVDRHYP